MFNPIEDSKIELRNLLIETLGVLVGEGKIPATPLPDFTVEIPNDPTHGDFSTNIALVSSKVLKQNPRGIAQLITDNINLDSTGFDKVEIAGPGFINFFVSKLWFSNTVNQIVKLGKDYGKTNMGKGKRILVEFVSANPTGPMHIGNARGGALGDCIAAVLNYSGYVADREFYVNDAGNQVEKLGLSLDIRYKQYFGENVEMPEDSYHGEDIIIHAQNYANHHGDKLLSLSEEERRKTLVEYALPLNISQLEKDLLKYRIKYDKWFLESTLHQSGAATKVVQLLTQRGNTYEKDGALWLKAEELGGDKDFVLVRSNGLYTYIVPDIAYHYDKLVTRNYDRAINVLGADHHGYVQRMRIALKALGIDETRLDVVIMQMVRLVRDKEVVKLSKRSGKAITLATLLDEVPIDAARFFFNLRDANTHLEFDLDLAIEESSQNPVFYVQYAHARICRIIEKLKEDGISPQNLDNDQLIYEANSELALIRKLSILPSEINLAASEYNPSRITRYSYELAQVFHKFYDECKIKDAQEQILQSRLSLCIATKTVFSNMLSLLKVEAPEKM